LLAKFDELVAIATRNLEEIRAVTKQLAPERAQLPQRHHDGVGDASTRSGAGPRQPAGQRRGVIARPAGPDGATKGGSLRRR
jgi:hypothetical protein